MNNILLKAYMVKTVICHTFAFSTIIIVLYSCMITMCTCICTRVSKKSRFFAVYVHKESILLWPDLFLAQDIYHLQYKHPSRALSMVVMLHGYLYVLNYQAVLVAYVTLSYLLLSP